MTQKRKITWLIYHDPIDLFLRTANAFCKEINELTNGRIEIDVYTTTEYGKKFKNGSHFEPMALINSGEVQMSQLHVLKLGEQQAVDFYALELPFLFRDHDHAAKVLEGNIGQDLLEKTLPSKTSVRGLAFTYSGGYRVMASSKEIKTAEDIKGLTIAIKNNPIFADMAEAFGAKYDLVLEADNNEIKSLRSESDTVQTTLSRYYLEANNKIHKHVTNTQHNLYLTTIVINDAFWNSLSIEDQMIIKQAALNSARKERAWSIEDAENIAKSEQEKEKLGIQSYHELPETEINKLKDSVTRVYEKYDNFFSTGLIKSIIKS